MSAIVVTTPTVPGTSVVRVLGTVVGSVAWFGNKYAEGIGDLNGNTHPDVGGVFERRRYEALRKLQRNAEAIGANAVVEVRFDSREITGTWKELCAYGTAVMVVEDEHY